MFTDKEGKKLNCEREQSVNGSTLIKNGGFYEGPIFFVYKYPFTTWIRIYHEAFYGSVYLEPVTIR
jgi:hypothetical protein